MSYYPAYICKNGHAISTTSSQCADRFCSRCGAPISNKCPNCGSIIRGRYDDVYAFASKYTVPAYCRDCGKPYPWTAAAIEATMYMIQESDIQNTDQEKLIESLPDMIAETPKTQLAAVRYKKAAALGGFIAEGLRDFAVNFACEAFKKAVGLP